MKNCPEIRDLFKDIVCNSFKMKGLCMPATWRIIHSFFSPLNFSSYCSNYIVLENHFEFGGAEMGLFIFCAIMICHSVPL